MADSNSSDTAPVAENGDQVTDGHGNHYPGSNIPGMNGVAKFEKIQEIMENLPKFVAREDDVWVCAFPKCGTHWTWEVVNMVLRGKAETIQDSKENVFLEMQNLNFLAEQPSPRVLNTHIPIRLMPKDVFAKRSKILLVVRNPKDTYVSAYYNFVEANEYYSGNWTAFFEFLPKFAKDKIHYFNWFAYNKDFWEFAKQNKDTVLVIKYESMLKDQVGHVRAIAEFLGKPLEQSLIEDIAQKCSFDYMKKAKKNDPFAGPDGEKEKKSEERIWKENAVGMYRKGKVGDWKNHFTVAQNERFDAVYQEQMEGCDLSVQFEI